MLAVSLFRPGTSAVLLAIDEDLFNVSRSFYFSSADTRADPTPAPTRITPYIRWMTDFERCSHPEPFGSLLYRAHQNLLGSSWCAYNIK